MAKKKKKLNKKFVIVAAVGTLAFSALMGFMVLRYVSRTSPEEYKERARIALEAGDSRAAFDSLGNMFLRDNSDMESLMWYYEAGMRLVSFGELHNRDYFNQAQRSLFTARTLDPRYIPALRAELNQRILMSEISGLSLEGIRSVEEAANAMLLVDPGDPQANDAKGASIAQRAMIAGGGTTTDTAAIVSALADLQPVLDKFPSSVELRYFRAALLYAQATSTRRDLVTQNDTPETRAMVEEADALLAQIEADADAGTGMTPAQRARAYQRVIMGLLGGGGSRVNPDSQAIAARLGEVGAKLLETDDPKDRLFLFRTLYAANLMEASGNPKLADKAYRKLVQDRPDHWSGRIGLAEFLARQSSRLPEAIEVLSVQLEPAETLYGVEGMIFRDNAIDAATLRAFYRLRHLSEVPEADRAAQRQLIEADLGRVAAARGENNPRLLMTRAGLAVLDENRVQALTLLDRALELTNDNDPRQRELRSQIRLQLADVNLQLGQTGRARDLLSEIVRTTGNVPARLMLAQLHISDRDFRAARAELQQVLDADPENAMAQRLIVQTLEDRTEAERVFGDLPETTVAQRFEKLRVALSIRRVEDALRLGESIIAEDPRQRQAAVTLADLYVRLNRRPDAVRVLDLAIAAMPEDEALVTARASVVATTNEELDRVREEAIENIEDPFRKRIAEAQLAQRRDDIPTMIAKLVEADSLDTAGNGRAAEMLFMHYGTVQDFDNAEKWLDRLAKLNADQAQGRIYRARLQIARGQVQDALTTARSLVSEMPGFVQPWVLLGQAHQFSGNWNEAMAAYNQALSQQPGNELALRGLVEALDNLGRGQETRTFIDRGLRADPFNPFFREAALSWMMRFGDPQAVIDPRERLLRQAPELPANWMNMGMAYVANARRKLAAGDQPGGEELFRKALDNYKQAIQRFPDNLSFLAEYANLSRILGDFDAGLRVLDTAMVNPAFRDSPVFAQVRSEYFFNAGQLDRAITELESFLASGKDDPGLRLRLAETLVQADRREDALKALASTTDPRATRLRINLMLDQNDAAGARQLVQGMLTTERTPETLNLAATVESRAGDTTAARALLDEVLRLESDNAQARYNRAVLMLRQPGSQMEEIIADLVVVRDRLSGNVEARLLLADLYGRTGRPTEQTREIEATLRDNPASKRAVNAAVDYYASTTPPQWTQVRRVIDQAKQNASLAEDPEIMMTESRLLAVENRPDRAIEVARAAVQASGNAPTFQRGYYQTLLTARQYEALLRESETVVDDTASTAWLRQARGIAYSRLKQPDRAMNEFDQAIRAASTGQNEGIVGEVLATVAVEIGIQPALDEALRRAQNDPRWKPFAADLYRRANNLPAAIAMYEQVLASSDVGSGERERVLRAVGPMYLISEPAQPARAVETFKELLKAQPNDIVALNNLAYAMSLPGSGGDLSQAIVHSERAYQLMAAQGVFDPYVMDTHGWLLVQTGRVDEGVTILLDALRQRPLPEIHYHLAEGYLRLGRNEPAAEHFNKSLALIDEARQSNQPFDSSLEARVRAGMSRLTPSPGDPG
jgi:tetratricopeptide (TPR) repeat protein